MYNPFPGMNPYLEHPSLWHQIHNRLIVALADVLTPQIVPKYRVSIEERIYTSIDDGLLVGIADVAVSGGQHSPLTISPAIATKPIPVQLPMPEEVTERFLEVKLTQSGEIVSVIEVLSPQNKRTGSGRDAYQTKRQKNLQSQTNLVEIDLLRGGDAMPILATVNTAYRILVSRGYSRPNADLYAFGLSDPLPTIPIPLKQGDVEPVVNLHTLLNEIHDRARFDLAIDYAQVIRPSLSAQEKDWVKRTLAEHNSSGDK